MYYNNNNNSNNSVLQNNNNNNNSVKKYNGTFYFFEPESPNVLYLGNNRFYASKMDAYVHMMRETHKEKKRISFMFTEMYIRFFNIHRE